MNFKKYIKMGSLLSLSALITFGSLGNTVAANKYKLNTTVNGYVNAENAKNKRNARVKYNAGEYYIYNTHNGMYNISRVKGSPGAWINPSENKNVTSAPKANTNTNNNSGNYTLNNSVRVYVNANDARNRRNAKSSYSKGTYYIYSRYNSMINITRVKGKPGAWINPADNKTVTPKPDPKPTPKPNPNPVNTSGDYKLNNSVRVYRNADDARTRRNSVSSYAAGNYYVYKNYNGMVNISRVKGKPGAWINPADNKAVTPKPAPKPTPKPVETPAPKPVETPAPKPVEKDTDYTLAVSVKVYGNAADAANRVNALKEYSAGDYYIYKKYNNMLNISKTKGKPGAWINPNDNKSSDTTNPVYEDKPGYVTPKYYTVESRLAQGTSVPVFESVNVYNTSKDALYGVNPIKKYEPGNYYLYNVDNNMLNISTTNGTPGGWINPVENRRTERLAPKANPSEFLAKIAPAAKELAENNDLYASVMIAQAMLESGYGTSVLGMEPFNNLFGVKGSYNGESVAVETWEYSNGSSPYKVVAGFKKYPSYYESLVDYVSVLTANDDVNSWRYKHYLGARFSQAETYEDATLHLTGRYATSPTYNVSLNNLIEKYNLTQYDMTK